MNYLKSVTFFILLLLSDYAYCQNSIGGIPLSKAFNLDLDNDEYDIGFVNNDELVATERPCNDIDKGCLLVYAKYFPLNKTMNNAGTWEILPDGRKVWRLTIKSVNAYSLSLSISNYDIPVGGKLFFYVRNHEQLDGAFTSYDVKENGVFRTGIFKGQEVTIEYNMPANGTIPNLTIEHVAHGYKDLSNGTLSALLCHNNVNCFQDWCNEIRSVVLLEVRVHYIHQTCGITDLEEIRSGFGSGALINNTADDFRPLILTAWHNLTQVYFDNDCPGGSTSYEDWTNFDLMQVYFNYESPFCNPSVVMPFEDNYRRTGVWHLASESGFPFGTDLALLELHEKPLIHWNTYYSGWNIQRLADLPSLNGVGIHHPAVDIKKISFGDISHNVLKNKFWKVDWNNGVTEPGSSGSPLFNDGDRRIIGALSHGANGQEDDNDPCDDTGQPDNYGRLLNFWHYAQSILEPVPPSIGGSYVSYYGIDPIHACQPVIDVNGTMLPAEVYRSTKTNQLIQAGTYLNIANLFSASIESRTAYSSFQRANYLFQAGNAINIFPNASDAFTTPVAISNNDIVADFYIASCVVYNGCNPSSKGTGGEKPGKALNSNNRNNDVLIDMNLTRELQYVQKDDWHININPNPTNNHVNVQTEFSAECIVYNIHGIVVAQYNFDSNINYKVDVSSLPNGVYIFEFRSKNSETNFSGKKSIKVVKY